MSVKIDVLCRRLSDTYLCMETQEDEHTFSIFIPKETLKHSNIDFILTSKPHTTACSGSKIKTVTPPLSTLKFTKPSNLELGLNLMAVGGTP